MAYYHQSQTLSRIGQRSLIPAIVALIPVVLGGCSLFLPHPERSSNNVLGDADTPRDGRCSLAVAQDRRSVPNRIAAEGIPTPLIIHAHSASSSNVRNISNGQPVAFEALTREASPTRNSSPETNRHASPGQVAPRSTLWRIEAVDLQGEAFTAAPTLADGSRLALHEDQGSGYLRLDAQGASIIVARAEASIFVLNKADVPDSTRPTTCDEQIRDEDFVFLRAVAPSAWVSMNPQGILNVQGAARGKPASDSHSNPLCARQEERCRTDSQGGLVCVSAPVCGE